MQSAMGGGEWPKHVRMQSAVGDGSRLQVAAMGMSSCPIVATYIKRKIAARNAHSHSCAVINLFD